MALTHGTVIDQLNISISELETGFSMIKEEYEILEKQIEFAEKAIENAEVNESEINGIPLYRLTNKELEARLTFSVKGFFMIFRQALDSVFKGVKVHEKKILKDPKREMPHGFGNGRIGGWFKKYHEGKIQLKDEFLSLFKEVEFIIMKGYLIRNAMKHYADFKVIHLDGTPSYFGIRIEKSAEKSHIGAYFNRMEFENKPYDFTQYGISFELKELKAFVEVLTKMKDRFELLNEL